MICRQNAGKARVFVAAIPVPGVGKGGLLSRAVSSRTVDLIENFTLFLASQIMRNCWHVLLSGLFPGCIRTVSCESPSVQKIFLLRLFSECEQADAIYDLIFSINFDKKELDLYE